MGVDKTSVVVSMTSAPQADVAKSQKKKHATLEQHLRKTKLCLYHMQGFCKHGDKCGFAHSPSEIESAPDLRGTRLCSKWQAGNCTDPNCGYAHGYGELRMVEDFCFKTVMCMWHASGKCRNGIHCRFAHSEKEIKQPPQKQPESVHGKQESLKQPETLNLYQQTRKQKESQGQQQVLSAQALEQEWEKKAQKSSTFGYPTNLKSPVHVEPTPLTPTALGWTSDSCYPAGLRPASGHSPQWASPQDNGVYGKDMKAPLPPLSELLNDFQRPIPSVPCSPVTAEFPPSWSPRLANAHLLDSTTLPLGSPTRYDVSTRLGNPQRVVINQNTVEQPLKEPMFIKSLFEELHGLQADVDQLKLATQSPMSVQSTDGGSSSLKSDTSSTPSTPTGNSPAGLHGTESLGEMQMEVLPMLTALKSELNQTSKEWNFRLIL